MKKKNQQRQTAKLTHIFSFICSFFTFFFFFKSSVIFLHLISNILFQFFLFRSSCASVHSLSCLLTFLTNCFFFLLHRYIRCPCHLHPHRHYRFLSSSSSSSYILPPPVLYIYIYTWSRRRIALPSPGPLSEMTLLIDQKNLHVTQSPPRSIASVCSFFSFIHSLLFSVPMCVCVCTDLIASLLNWAAHPPPPPSHPGAINSSPSLWYPNTLRFLPFTLFARSSKTNNALIVFLSSHPPNTSPNTHNTTQTTRKKILLLKKRKVKKKNVRFVMNRSWSMTNIQKNEIKYWKIYKKKKKVWGEWCVLFQNSSHTLSSSLTLISFLFIIWCTTFIFLQSLADKWKQKKKKKKKNPKT